MIILLTLLLQMGKDLIQYITPFSQSHGMLTKLKPVVREWALALHLSSGAPAYWLLCHVLLRTPPPRPFPPSHQLVLHCMAIYP